MTLPNEHTCRPMNRQWASNPVTARSLRSLAAQAVRRQACEGRGNACAALTVGCGAS